MKFLILFIYLTTTIYSYAIEKPDIENIVINKNPKTYEEIVFKDLKQKDIDLANYKGKLIILNFWATWCAPCREEMPSLDLLQSDSRFNNLKIFPINIGQEDLLKSEIFFRELKIKNLNIYFDSTINLAKKLSLRGIPTTILFNKEGKEFARIIGSIDFNDQKFIEWLSFYN
jgi:thiol-disulfide isomerase/thioredoxin